MMASEVIEEIIEVIDESFENVRLIPLVEYKNTVEEARTIDFDDPIVGTSGIILNRIDDIDALY
jgi:hypothetical protein